MTIEYLHPTGPTAAASYAHPGPTTQSRGPSQERLKRQPVLGGLINEYERAA